MGLQRGRMGAAEREFYAANKDTMSVTELAAKYNRSEKSVQKALDSLNVTVGASVAAPAVEVEGEKKNQ